MALKGSQYQVEATTTARKAILGEGRRISWHFSQRGSAPVYIGFNSAVSQFTGTEVRTGGRARAWGDEAKLEVWVIAQSGTQRLDIMEVLEVPG